MVSILGSGRRTESAGNSLAALEKGVNQIIHLPLSLELADGVGVTFASKSQMDASLGWILSHLITWKLWG